jgi:hypothetical protein
MEVASDWVWALALDWVCLWDLALAFLLLEA